MESLNSRLEKLVNEEHRHRQVMAVATRGLIDGTATPEGYRIVAGADAKKQLKRWIPTLTLAAARRQLELPRGTQLPVGPAQWPTGWHESEGVSRCPWVSLPGEVLSYPPNEKLPPGLTEQLVELDDVLRTASQNLQERDVCAIARLVIGPGHGLTRRKAVWNGKCQAQAAIKSCDYERWYNAGILGIWPQLADFLASRRQPPVVVGFSSRTHKLVASYEAFERAMWQMPLTNT